MLKETVIKEMINVFHDVPYGVDHTLKVLQLAEDIMTGESIDSEKRELITITAILHDIGALEAQRKYGSMEAKYQEKEGAIIARQILEKVGYEPGKIDRVCYIVGNHHTPEKIDGIDFQVLWEADLIANMEAMDIKNDIEKLPGYIEENFKTTAGKVLAKEYFLNTGGI
ncbi:HD domain-containing protein [Desulforamulus aquiferis]|uniref:HD domain-containing protein n=1 Tax=Desulforamulus aquiferis TaxID=1397668 RepID=A0AAW7ZIZ5_9FIRM|nr:HD domain-containing protein [Desulforamulus aquiferis]MDO7789200.1 HD domain-containing protein [Desulforamulus aquiferis]